MTSDLGSNDADFITPDDGFSSSTSDDAQPSQAQADDDNGEGGDTGTDEDAELIAALDEEEGDKPETDEELKEIERKGKKYKIPAALEGELMMQEDYTRKTQEVAEHRRALEQQAEAIRAHEQNLHQQAEVQRANLKHYAQLETMNETLDQYSKVDWEQLEREDPLGANSHWRTYQVMKEQRQNLVQNLQEHESRSREEQQTRHQAATQAYESEVAKRMQASLEEVQRVIPGWNGEVANQVGTYLHTVGYPIDDMKVIATDPKSMVLVHKAMKFDQLMAKAAASKAKQPTADLAPLAVVARGRTAAAPSGLDDRLSADEWARRRNEQVRKKR